MTLDGCLVFGDTPIGAGSGLAAGMKVRTSTLWVAAALRSQPLCGVFTCLWDTGQLPGVEDTPIGTGSGMKVRASTLWVSAPL